MRADLARPLPPADLARFLPAPEVLAWIRAHLINPDGLIHNPDHAHLWGADLEVMWAPGGFIKAMRRVIGQAEEVTFRAGGWQRARQVEQMEAWFGRVPGFLITLDAEYCSTCSDAEWCALVEHELYHLAHKLDEFGSPAFTKEGMPKLTIRGHDVEEFVGVVRRYGAGDKDGAVAQMVRAAGRPAEMSAASVAGACGTCLLRAA